MRMTLGAFGLLAMMTVGGAAFAAEQVLVNVDGVDAPRVRAAALRELAEIEPPAHGTVTIHRDQADVATIVYESEDGRRRLERTVDLQSDPEEAADEIALVAASLARDEPEVRRVPAPPMPPPPVVRPLRVAPESKREGRAMPGREICRSRPATIPFGLDFAPYVGTSSSPVARSSTRFIALNVVGGYGAALSGVEAGMVNVESDYVCGAPAAAIANVVGGDVIGSQTAGIANVNSGSLRGIQVAGIADVVNGPVRGLQLAGVANVATDVTQGAQIGMVNVTSGKIHGLQMGLVNVAEKSDLSIGLVNINTKGRTELELWSEVESGIVALGIKHGGDHWHSIYGIATRLTEPAPAPVLGLGGHIVLGPRVFLDIDATAYALFSLKQIKLSTVLYQARPVLGWKIADRFALVGGPSWNLLDSRNSKSTNGNWAPGYATQLGGGQNPALHSWPGAVVGVQALSD
jgi:hypothetical protein